MTLLHYTLNTRQLTSFTPLSSELNFDPQKNYLFDLSYLTALHVKGERAQEFLQGQLSCDLREVTDRQMQQGALCNLKGRVLSLMDVIDWQTQGVHLLLPQDLSFDIQNALAKPAMFSRVSIHPHTAIQIFGFYLQNREDIIPFELELDETPYSVQQNETFCCYNLGNNLYIIIVNSLLNQTITTPFISQSQWRGSLAWHALQLRHHKITIYPESQAMFLPHRLDLQLSSYLSFNKGCYKGQEIIARTHYRAKLKHTLKIFTIQFDGTLKSGLLLFNEIDHQELGELIDFCPIAEGKFLIAVSILFVHPQTVLLEEQLIGLHSIN